MPTSESSSSATEVGADAFIPNKTAAQVFIPKKSRRWTTREQFDSLDSDNSGSLSRDEVIRGLAARGLPSSKREVDEFFNKVDLDGDGLVSFAEYSMFAAEHVRRLREVFDSLDFDKNGRLTTGELKRAAKALGFTLSSEQLRKVTQHADVDRDGALSFDEFVSFLLLIPSINPAAAIEAFDAFYIESAASEYAAPAEVEATERAQLLSALAAKAYSGSIAGGVSRTVTAPIDRLKTLMQAAPPGQPSGGLVDGLRRIYRDGNGFHAFFRGNSVNVMKIAPETSIKFIAFDLLKSSLAHDRDNVTVQERLVAGGGAGAIAQAVIYPLEILKTRMAISSEGTYAGVVDCMRQIVRNEGMPALYQGLTTSLVGIVPYAGIDLAANSALKEVATRYYAQRQEEPSVLAVLACGMLSSTTAMLGTYPLNLVRTRLQASGMPGSPVYAGALDCFRQTVKAGGVRSLYQGLLPNMLKVLPATSISYTIYDCLARKS